MGHSAAEEVGTFELSGILLTPPGSQRTILLPFNNNKHQYPGVVIRHPFYLIFVCLFICFLPITYTIATFGFRTFWGTAPRHLVCRVNLILALGL